MKKYLFIIALFVVMGAFFSCASVPKDKPGMADSTAALVSLSLEGNADAYSGEDAIDVIQSVLAEVSGLSFADNAEVERVLQREVEKSRKKSSFRNMASFVTNSKSALDTFSDEISIRNKASARLEKVNDQSEFAQDLQKVLAKDEMTKCKTFVYVTVSGGVMERKGFVKPLVRTVVRHNNKKGKNIRTVMTISGGEAVNKKEAVAERGLVSDQFTELTEKSLRLAAENLYTVKSSKKRFTMEMDSLITKKPFNIMIFYT